MSGLPQFHLPDLLAQWPCPRVLNQHYEETKPEFDKCVRGFEALDAKSQSAFDRCNFDCLRVTCDLAVLYFMYDEYTDNLDEDGVRACADEVMDALRHPHKERPQGESKLGEIARQFWLRAIKVASERTQRRFLKSFAAYVYAVIDEASDRKCGRVRGIRDYLELRRLTVAVYPSFFSVELGLDIPDEIMTHPAMETLLGLVADSTVLTNDLYSYNIEQAAGHGGHNLLTAVMSEKGVDLDGALDWLTEYNGEILSRFREQFQDAPVRLAYWIRGHDCWSFESERYFGTKGPEIQKHRLVTLLPKSRRPEVTPMMALPCASTSDSE
ncbi:terpenoid synthase [Lactarius psammicola]|nr:terpenoid synthase [Lactarius psammicola]